jgi:hypothetical protein
MPDATLPTLLERLTGNFFGEASPFTASNLNIAITPQNVRGIAA